MENLFSRLTETERKEGYGISDKYLHGLKKPRGSIDGIIDYNGNLNRRNLIHKAILPQLD